MALNWLLGTKVNLRSGQGSTALLISALAFSLMTVCVKKLDSRIPVAEIVLCRALFSLLITRIMLFQSGIQPWGNRKGLLVVRGFLGTTALLCFFKSLTTLTLASATVVQYTYPTFTAIAAWLLLGEKVKKRIGIAIILGWLGISFIVNPNWLDASKEVIPCFATIIALLGAMFTALAYVSVRKLSTSEHQLVIVYYFPLVSLPVTIPLVWGDFVIPNIMDWVWLIGIGVLTQIGQVMITKGLSEIPAGKASSINYIQVLFATLWGLMIFGESIERTTMIGALLIFAATLISINTKDKCNQ